MHATKNARHDEHIHVYFMIEMEFRTKNILIKIEIGARQSQSVVSCTSHIYSRTFLYFAHTILMMMMMMIEEAENCD